MMSIQLKIWKRLITNQSPLSCHHVSKAMSLLPPPAIYAKPYFKSPNFCTETAVPSTTPPDRGVIVEFLLNKCNLTEEDITNFSRRYNYYLECKSVQKCEEVLELLNGCGLTTPAQIRRVTLHNPQLFFNRSDIIIKSKLSFLRTFMKEEDITKLIYRNSRSINFSEDRLKSAVSLLRKLGLDDEVISKLVANEPSFLLSRDKEVIQSFKEAGDLGIKKGSKTFLHALRATLKAGKEKIDRRRLHFSSLGFSEKQISQILRWHPMVLTLSEEKVKRSVDFLVSSVGLSLDDLVKYPSLFQFSLEKRLIPRYRVLEALKAMQMLKTERRFPTIAIWPEKRFLKECVNSSAESSSVLRDIYDGGKAGKLIIDKETCSECDSVKKTQECCEISSSSSQECCEISSSSSI